MAGIFSKSHVYCIGERRTGDGCGFNIDDSTGEKARWALADYLDRALTLVPSLEMFVRFTDETTGSASPVSFDRIGPDDLRTFRTRFKNDEFLVVEADMAGDES